jgi:NAD(P)-dependent dehydrogenase (short-subunit alcohol dehydrogenase family)
MLCCACQALPFFRKRGGGAYVTVSSIVATTRKEAFTMVSYATKQHALPLVLLSF